MKSSPDVQQLLRPGAIVASIASRHALDAAPGLDPELFDFYEIRVDAFSTGPEAALSVAANLSKPIIITVRDQSEGGLGKLDIAARRELFKMFLPHAALIDIELALAGELACVLDAARKSDVAIIGSHHNFQRPTPEANLRELATQAVLLGCAVFKAAVMLRHPSDLVPLLQFIPTETRLRLSLMGMGVYGKASRLLLAQAGSVLNYAHLGSGQVPGQWPLEIFRARLNEVSL
jgi:3-dehydroquinate dehydratase-1